MKSQRKIGSILSYIQIIIQTIITIGVTPILIKFLGDAEYGVYNLTASVISYLSLLTLGMGASYVRYFFKYKNANKSEYISNLNGLYMITHIFMSIISIIIGIFIVKNIHIVLKGEMTANELQLSSDLMKIMMVNIALTFPDSVFNSYITAKEHFIFQKIIGTLKVIFNPLLGIVFLMLGYRSIGLSVAITLITLLSLLLNMFYSIKKLDMKFNFSIKDFRLLKDILVFSSFIFISMIIDQINWQVDKIILGKYVGSVAVAIYSIGALINTQYIHMSTSVSSVFIARVNDIVQSDDVNSKNNLSNLFIRIGRIQYYVLMLILIGFIGLGKYFITNLWVGNSYIDAYLITLILIIPVTIPLIQNIGIEIQKSMNKHQFRSVIYLLIAIVNIIMSIPLAKRFGPIGSAIGTGITTFIGNGLIMNMYYKNSIGLDIKRFWVEIFSISKGMILPLLISIFIAIRGINSFIEFIISGIIIVVVYSISVYKISFNEYEHKFFHKPIKLINNKIKK